MWRQWQGEHDSPTGVWQGLCLGFLSPGFLVSCSFWDVVCVFQFFLWSGSFPTSLQWTSLLKWARGSPFHAIKDPQHQSWKLKSDMAQFAMVASRTFDSGKASPPTVLWTLRQLGGTVRLSPLLCLDHKRVKRISQLALDLLSLFLLGWLRGHCYRGRFLDSVWQHQTLQRNRSSSTGKNGRPLVTLLMAAPSRA